MPELRKNLSLVFITFPDTAAEQTRVKEFQQLPQCCVQSTVPMLLFDEYVYVNRRKFHSINVQFICDVCMVILSAIARVIHLAQLQRDQSS